MLLGWLLIAALVGLVAFVLHRFGAPGGTDEPKGGCCHMPKEH